MGAIVVVLAIIGALVLFAYLKFPPAYADKKLVKVFDRMVMGVCGMLCLVWFINIRTTWMGTINDNWWQPIAIAGALGIEAVVLGICFLLRNFWIFKPPSRPGGRGFGF
jgi:hypothetical protein